MIDPKKIARLKRLVEMTDSFTQIVAIEKKLNERLDSEIKDEKEKLEVLIKEFKATLDKAKSEMSDTFGGLRQKTVDAINRLFVSNDVNKKLEEKLNEADAILARVDEKLSQIRNGRDADEKAVIGAVLSQIRQPKDGIDGEKGEKGDSGKDGKDFDPKEFESLREELFILIRDELRRNKKQGGIGDSNIAYAIQRLGISVSTLIALDTTNFNGLLSSTENTIQKAFDLLDDHNHDSRYYTETELNNGQLDTRYYTETEVNSLTKCIDFTIINPSTIQPVSNEVFIMWAKSALTFTKVQVELDISTQNVTGDIKYADDFLALANPVVINDFDTTSGKRTDTTLASASVAIGKAVYLSFDALPHADIKQMHVHLEFNY